MELLKTETDAIAPFILHGINLVVSADVGFPTLSGTLLVNSASPSADFILPFEDLQMENIDNIVFFKYLCDCVDVVRAIKTARSILKEGGKLIILEKLEYNEKTKRTFYPQEMEGVIYLFKDFFSIEQKFFMDNTFVFVLVKKGRTI